jgi:hypothetical protein
MKRIGVAAFVILSFLPACSNSSKDSSTDSSKKADSMSAAAEVPLRKGKALVSELPAGVEGVELADGGLRVLKGYEVVRDSDSTFFVARVNTGRRPTGTSGSCKCTSGTGKCTDGGVVIVVCVPADTTCTTCGLALTVGGVTTPIFIY